MHDLNAKQRDAVLAENGPVLIVAGPGTGKTKTLTARIAHLLERGVPASRILALTFTVKSAREMRERVAALTGLTKLSTISTFHALGHKLLRENSNQATLEFVSEAGRLGIIRELPRPQELKALSVRELALLLSRFKGEADPDRSSAIAHLTDAYQAELTDRNLLDYDDLLYRAQTLLATDETARIAWRSRYDHILIDEFQDTSELQWRLIHQIRGTDSVFVIGDPKQSIYGFRGAGAGMFDRFREDFPQRQDVALDVNYRSDKAIVTLASAIFGGADTLKPWSTAVGEVRTVQTLNEFSEADFVLTQIEEGIGGSDLLKVSAESKGRRLRDFAVLYRTHQAARTIQRRLQESGIPHQVVGEGSPYEEPHIQLIVDVLRWFAGGEVPRAKKWSHAQLATRLAAVDRSLAVSVLAAAVAEALGCMTDPKARVSVQQLIGGLVRFDAQEDGLIRCLEYFDQIAEEDFYDHDAEAVTLMTIHASKGLEFPHVILIAAEEGILPNIRKTKETDFEEEKRLFYVAATRAQQQLDIVYAQKRGGEDRAMSRFVAELDQSVLPRQDDPALPQLQKKLQKREQKRRQATLF